MVQKQLNFPKEFFRAVKSRFNTNVFQRLVTNPIILCGWIMMVLTCSFIVINAVISQSGPHPAPLFREPEVVIKTNQEPILNQAKKIQSIPVRTLVEDIQMALFLNGYYNGEIDGKVGFLTEQAIQNFQNSSNLPVNSQVNETLLAQILLSNPKINITEIDYLSEHNILTVQEALANLGFGPVKIDGKLTQQTKEAIEKFEQNRGLPVTGKPSDTLFNELRDIGELPNQ